jgi:hypothetical protein
VTDEAAKSAAPGGPTIRSRKGASRLGQNVLLQALIAALCILALRHPLAEPPAHYLVTALTLNDRKGARNVTLPEFVPYLPLPNEPALFLGTFDHPKDDAREVWSVYLPRFTSAVEVSVNGIEILDSRRDPAANRPDRATPQIAVIPASLLRNGANELAIRLYLWGPISGFLDHVYIGPDEQLRPYFELRTLVFVTLPMVFAAWQAILAVILAIMWLKRRHEAAYGALALAMALGAVQAFPQSAMNDPAFPALNATLIASAPLESGRVLAFGILFFGRRWPRMLGPLIFVPGLLIALIGLFADNETLRRSFVVLGLPAVGAHLILLAAIVAAADMRRRDVPSLLLGSAVTIVLTCLIHDVLEIAHIIPDDRLFFTRLSYSAMLVAIGAGLTWRFARAQPGRRLCRAPCDQTARGRAEAESKFCARAGARASCGTGARTHAADARSA